MASSGTDAPGSEPGASQASGTPEPSASPPPSPSPAPTPDEAKPAPKGALVESIEGVGQLVFDAIETVGGLASLGIEILRQLVRPPIRLGLFFEHMDFVGVGSTLLVCLTGLFTGMVFAKQSLYAFGLFQAQSLVGPTVGLTLTRELGPVFTALMVTMRAGSSICTFSWWPSPPTRARAPTRWERVIPSTTDAFRTISGVSRFACPSRTIPRARSVSIVSWLYGLPSHAASPADATKTSRP